MEGGEEGLSGLLQGAGWLLCCPGQCTHTQAHTQTQKQRKKSALSVILIIRLREVNSAPHGRAQGERRDNKPGRLHTLLGPKAEHCLKHIPFLYCENGALAYVPRPGSCSLKTGMIAMDASSEYLPSKMGKWGYKVSNTKRAPNSFLVNVSLSWDFGGNETLWKHRLKPWQSTRALYSLVF